LALAVSFSHGALAAASDAGAAAPPAPPLSVPDLAASKAVVLCVNCPAPFDTQTHKNLLVKLVANPYVGELRRALYVQDSLHQFESKVHFDNCDFDDAVDYLNERLDEAGKHVAAAERAKATHDTAGEEKEVRAAFYAIGQALHGAQDFYAHSNYVELKAPKVAEITDLQLVEPWRPGEREKIHALQKEGLVSGFVFWGFPQKCAAGAMSHHDLAKDSADTPSGQRKLANLQNASQYDVAVFLARETSLRLLSSAFKRWPLLLQVNGQAVAIDILVDRREL
jgi:hypothetical protein